uniref:Dynein light chain n=1 Tax=Ananas comosus var. bracteatus TaxID=296719 RepID=A0A6V7QTS2_ANACO
MQRLDRSRDLRLLCANSKHQTAVVMMGSHHRSKTGGLFGRCNAIEKEMRRHSVSDAKPAMQEGCLEKLRVHVLTAGQGDRNNFVPGRKSLPHIETNAADVAAVLRVKVVAADMPPFMQLHAFRCARRAYDTLDKFSSRQMAHDIKKEFDKAYGRHGIAL